MSVKSKSRPSRTQAERRATTRRMLLDATIETLQEMGYKGCTIAAVARNAGMTTGAVQHHFKSKSALMQAVIAERIYNTDAPSSLAGAENKTIKERTRLIIDEMWRYYGNPNYSVIWEIILGARDDSALLAAISQFYNELSDHTEKQIGKFFADLAITPGQARALNLFLNSQLRGLSLSRVLINEEEISDQLDILESLITMRLGG